VQHAKTSALDRDTLDLRVLTRPRSRLSIAVNNYSCNDSCAVLGSTRSGTPFARGGVRCRFGVGRTGRAASEQRLPGGHEDRAQHEFDSAVDVPKGRGRRNKEETSVGAAGCERSRGAVVGNIEGPCRPASSQRNLERPSE
jgi:hypothetical protein